MSDQFKRAAANAALDYVEDGMTLGLGTGSTAAHFVDLLGEKVRNGFSVKGIPTSEDTRQLAERVGIDLIEPDETTTIDIAIDGADEIDASGRLIKGGGGALLREKIVAEAAKKFIVIADGAKNVAELGKFPLPVEIDPFSWALTVKRIRETLDGAGQSYSNLALRHKGEEISRSDGGNLIVDCALDRISDPEALDSALHKLPGVIETGLFIGLTDIIILGEADGTRTISI